MVQSAVEAVSETLLEALGEQLRSLYLFGSYGTEHYDPDYSDVNLLVVVADDTNLHELRRVFLPLWQEHGDVLRRAPLIAGHTAFVRHLQLFPLFAHHLAQAGRPLVGARLFADEVPAPHPVEQAAYWCHQALLASPALAPELLPAQAAASAQQRLFRLARQLDGDAAGEDASIEEVFTHVQSHVQDLIDNLAIPRWTAEEAAVDSPLSPNLQAVYEETSNLIMVIPPLVPDLLRQIEWGRLAANLEAQDNTLRVATASQLRLSVQSETPLDFALGRYQHVWGQRPMKTVVVAAWGVLRQAARIPSAILIDTVPGAYLTTANERRLHRLVHDFQNRLLNLRLQHELLYRLHGFEAAAPSTPLPEQEEPVPVRIDAIVEYLDWWAAHYTREMEAMPPDHKLHAA